MNTDKGKATWDVSCTWIFIEEWIEQIYKKQCQGSSFMKQGWKNIFSGFNEKTGKSHDKKQLKNRLDSLKKEWKAWNKLFSKETSITFDYASNMVIAEDEWMLWHRERKCSHHLQHNGLGNDEEDVYQPIMDLEESSSDSEKELQGANIGGSVQVPIDLEGVTLTTNTQPSAPSGSGTIGKRKGGGVKG
ncbi:hypothetical protein K1719_011903 [Acacia pycnantha]|nr:hypothetical protein K1719_011903 [Acacia pycnantha]